MGDGDLSIGYHVLFSDGANDFGNLCRNQMDANFVTLVVLLSSTFLLCLQAINDGVNGVGLAKTYLCIKLFYFKEIRHRKEIYQLNSYNSLAQQCRLSVSDSVVLKGCLSVSNHCF